MLLSEPRKISWGMSWDGNGGQVALLASSEILQAMPNIFFET